MCAWELHTYNNTTTRNESSSPYKEDIGKTLGL